MQCRASTHEHAVLLMQVASCTPHAPRCIMSDADSSVVCCMLHAASCSYAATSPMPDVCRRVLRGCLLHVATCSWSVVHILGVAGCTSALSAQSGAPRRAAPPPPRGSPTAARPATWRPAGKAEPRRACGLSAARARARGTRCAHRRAACGLPPTHPACKRLSGCAVSAASELCECRVSAV